MRPIAYDLWLNPNLKTGIFSGSTDIALNITAPTKLIKLHSHKLHILELQVVAGDEKIISVSKHNSYTDPPQKYWRMHFQSRFELNERGEFLEIYLNEEIAPAASYTLHIRFEGDLTNRIVGLYKSVYKNGNIDKLVSAIYFIYNLNMCRLLSCMPATIIYLHRASHWNTFHLLNWIDRCSFVWASYTIKIDVNILWIVGSKQQYIYFCNRWSHLSVALQKNQSYLRCTHTNMLNSVKFSTHTFVYVI